jgi:hypothetical protein
MSSGLEPLAYPVALHAADVTTAGAKQIWTGDYERTQTSKGVSKVAGAFGASEKTQIAAGEWAEFGISSAIAGLGISIPFIPESPIPPPPGASVPAQQVSEGFNPQQIAEAFKEQFGQYPDAIYVVGSHAEGAATLASDIDIVIETTIPGLSKHACQGFEFFKTINPGKVPEGVQGIGPNPGQAFIGEAPGEIPKPGLVDPFFGTPDPSLGPSIRVW